jgi:TM2 domain-containing membrane protein YozV
MTRGGRGFCEQMSPDRVSAFSPAAYTAALASIAPAPSSPAPVRAQPPSSDAGAALALAGRHPRLVAAALATAACVLIASASTVVSLLQLPALVLAAPWALSLSLVATALFVERHARKRVGTGGVEADVERRILDVAVAHRGRVTTTAVAHALSMPLGEADAALTALSRAGYLAIETHPASGVIVYVFPEIDAGLVPPRAPGPGEPIGGSPPEVTPVRPGAMPIGASVGLVRVSCKSRGTAALLAICGGAFGAHKFYLGEPLAGMVHLVMFWTFLPALAGFFEGLGYLFMSDHAFDLKHNTRLA